jgi:hypothetical protein
MNTIAVFLDWIPLIAVQDANLTEILLAHLSTTNQLVEEAVIEALLVLGARSFSLNELLREDCIYKPIFTNQGIRQISNALTLLHGITEYSQLQLAQQEYEMPVQSYKCLTRLANVLQFNADDSNFGLLTDLQQEEQQASRQFRAVL